MQKTLKRGLAFLIIPALLVIATAPTAAAHAQGLAFQVFQEAPYIASPDGTALVAGYVYNPNDPALPPVEGAKVEVYAGEDLSIPQIESGQYELVATVYSDEQGYYRFTGFGLPGAFQDYTLRVSTEDRVTTITTYLAPWPQVTLEATNMTIRAGSAFDMLSPVVKSEYATSSGSAPLGDLLKYDNTVDPDVAGEYPVTYSASIERSGLGIANPSGPWQPGDPATATGFPWTNQYWLSGYGESTITVTVVPAKVTAHHQDSEGNELAASVVYEGKIGDPYKTEALDIEGYKLVASPANAEGVHGDEDLDLVYVYEQLPVAPGETAEGKDALAKTSDALPVASVVALGALAAGVLATSTIRSRKQR